LYDIREAATLVVDFVAGKRLEDYQADALLRSAVERQLEIIGEALTQLAKVDRQLVARISVSSPFATCWPTATSK
jgi:uncharacterized protein with HEPN domain